MKVRRIARRAVLTALTTGAFLAAAVPAWAGPLLHYHS